MRPAWLRLLLLLLTVLLALPTAAFAEGAEMAEEAEPLLLEVHQMMIGCADGYLLRLGDVYILMDGGEPLPQSPQREALAYLTALDIPHLDAVIITHWHLDHCMSLNEILTAFGTEETIVYSPAAAVPDAINNGTVTVAVGPLVKGEHRQMKMGDVLTYGGLTITCTGPESLSQGGGCNQDSLNLLVQYGSRRFLFVGDFAQSKSINGAYKELCTSVDVLKFPHHGIEPYEIGNNAMRIVRPTYVLVPGVVNKHKIWDYADNLGVKFARENVLTNADGHVIIITDGGERFDVLTHIDPAEYASKGE